MPDVNDFRKAVARKRASVTSKISRFRKSGIELAGTEHDPRRDTERTKRYNSRQLQSYLGKLNEFMSRGTQFHTGSQGGIITKKAWDNYKRIESEYNGVRKRYEASVNKVVFQGNDFATRKSLLAHPTGRTVNEIYPEISRAPSDLIDDAAVSRMSEFLKTMMTPEYVERRITNQRAGVRKMLDIMGENMLSDDIDELSDYQFDLMWFGPTGAAQDLKSNYERAKEVLAGRIRDKQIVEMIEESFDDFKDTIKWAGEQPTHRPE